MRLKTPIIQSFLFMLSIFTTLLAGAELTTGKSFWTGGEHGLSWHELSEGAAYSFAFLLFLSVHEFGHYFTARYHQVKSSLPYYIPLYIPMMLNIGSLGAVIRLRQVPQSTRKYFDIGIAGPLAGFVVSIGLLVYGFQNLPPEEAYVLDIHPEYQTYFGGLPTEAEQSSFILEKKGFDFLTAEEKNSLLSVEEQAEINDPLDREALQRERYQPVTVRIGSNLLYEALKRWVPDDPEQVPDPFEMIHYPWLFVGYITLFFTALNLLPMGQLDGGHIIYGMFGRKKAGQVARITALLLILVGGMGFMDFRRPDDFFTYLGIGLYALYLTYMLQRLRPSASAAQIGLAILLIMGIQSLVKLALPDIQVSLIWLIYAFLAVRFIGLDHPRALHEHRVNRPRQILGWVAILIFVLCFTPFPIEVVG
jgi:membrane-associated protease RseP (regulator of RpoE activity)